MKNGKLRRATLSAFYNISQRNFGILLFQAVMEFLSRSKFCSLDNRSIALCYVSTYFSPCSVSFVLSGEYIQYSPLINFRLIIPSNIHLQLIIPSNIHLQCLCSTKNEKKQHNEGNMALRITSILNH